MDEHESVPEKISISYEDLQAVPEVRIGSQTTVEPQGSGNTALPQGKRRKNTAVIFSLLGVILVLTLFVVLSLVLSDGNSRPPDDSRKSPPATPGEGSYAPAIKVVIGVRSQMVSSFAEDDAFAFR